MARQQALTSAERHQRRFLKDPSILPLDDHYLEGEHCWMFFRNRAIVLPEEFIVGNGIPPLCAYIVSKRGEGRTIVDLSEDPAECEKYLKFMSDYFMREGL